MNADQNGTAGEADDNDLENAGDTFETDVSETDDEGTTVRHTYVNEDDLSEADKNED
jgi:hypothetical protein